MSLNSFVLNLKRGETPFYRRLRTVLRQFRRPTVPRIPRILKPPLRILYEMHFGIISAVRLVLTVFYRNPLFQARCASVGKRLSLDGLPFISGHAEIHIGDDVWIGGNFIVDSARVFEHPKLVIQDHVELGWNVTLTANKEVVIEEYAMIAADCRISDSDGHPREADLRAQKLPPHAKDILPVRIGRYAWIGSGSHIMKGVTIGEGAIVGANSFVITDVPPYCLAMGNPAEVYFRNIGRPTVRK
jgi:acetyltransferase-like isoleucine patch superfamily enzyme